jgi:hypothetical protein
MYRFSPDAISGKRAKIDPCRSLNLASCYDSVIVQEMSSEAPNKAANASHTHPIAREDCYINKTLTL